MDEKLRSMTQDGDLGLLEKQRELEEVKRSGPTILAYAPVLVVALLKDMLDFVGIGSLPAIGTVVTICFSLLIFLLLLITRANHKLIDARFIMRAGLVLLFGTLVESLAFGLNFLPIETLVIFLIYFLDKNLNAQQIENLIRVISLHVKARGGRSSYKRRNHPQNIRDAQAAAANR